MGEEILKAVVNAVDVPVTLKTRTGWDTDNKNCFPEQSKHKDTTLDIEFDNIDFTYPDGQQKVLKDLSLSLPLGTKTAIVGQTHL